MMMMTMMVMMMMKSMMILARMLFPSSNKSYMDVMEYHFNWMSNLIIESVSADAELRIR